MPEYWASLKNTMSSVRVRLGFLPKC
uniref:Uncharacterized protein n=1 Tax=Anguilla anguilla TaxID=7936 RepID=A0A0E9TJE3_ANGAN